MTASVLLLMDFQNGIVERYGDAADATVAAAGRALAAAREHGMHVMFVRVAFRPGFPEVSDSNRSFSATRETSGRLMWQDQPETQIVGELAPRDDEPVILKRRVGAFSGSDLDVLLRGARVDELVLAGIATSGVVLSTLRLAADLDYRLTVLADACGDADPEVHRVLTGKVFPRQATVTTVDEWTASLG